MSAREEGIKELALPDMERRIANTVRYGTISAINPATRRVRVRSGEIETAWLPWSAGRAGAGKRRWDAPEIGEQVIILAPTGDLRQAGVIPGFYQDSFDAPSSNVNKDKTEYGDGTVIEYDRALHALTVDLQGTKLFADRTKIELTIGGTTLTMTADSTTLTTPEVLVDSPQSTFTGAVTVEGQLTYQGGLAGSGGAGSSIQGDFRAESGVFTHNNVNVGSTHTHSGVQPGGGTTEAPT